ncbi:MAG TPA: ATP-binding protein [Candidatus Aquilonibacter sp.]
MTAAVKASGVADVVELRIPGKAEWVAVARLAVSAVASRLKFSIEEIEDIRLAVAEACTDSIQSAGGQGQIDIWCESAGNALRVRVRREGSAEKTVVSEADADADDEVSGLGIFLVRALMDEVEYSVHPERGTDLTMVKYVGA